jgi:ubiquitin carboxyl-terminal hydrolase 1
MGAVDKEGLRDRGIAGVLDFGHRGSGSTSKGSFPNFGPGSQTKSFTYNDNEQRMLDDTRSWSLGNSNSLITKSVFDGLTANRRSCVKCGYTEAVMHFGFDNWQLAVPRLAVSKLLHIPVPFPHLINFL